MKFLVAFVSMLASAAFCYDTVTSEQVRENGIAVVTDGDLACAMDEATIRCWGDGKAALEVPTLVNPRVLAIGEGGVCAIDDDGLRCWGYYLGQQVDFPRLVRHNVSYISSGWEKSCAIKSGDVVCWENGGVEDKIIIRYPYRNPRVVTAGPRHYCVIDDNGVSCREYNGQVVQVPKLIRPRQVTAFRFESCALDDNGVHCWETSYKNEIRRYRYPGFSGVKQLSSGPDFLCGLDNVGVKCRPSDDYPKLPELKNPVQISRPSSRGYLCAVDDEGAKCWSPIHGNLFEPSEFTKSRRPNFSLDGLEKAFEVIAKASYGTRRDFYRGLASKLNFVSKEAAGREARYLALRLAGVIIENTESEIFSKTFAPRYRLAKEKVEREFVLALPKLVVNEPTLTICLEATRLALNGTKSFLASLNDRELLERMISQIGQFQLQAGSSSVAQSAAKLRAVLQANEKLIDNLTTEPRTRGFGNVLQLVKAHLGK